MKRKTVYTEAPSDISESIMEAESAVDFLPPPDQLVRRSEKVKVTISLNSSSVDFFKKSAKKNKVKYQTMINEVLDQYVRHFDVKPR